MGEVVPFKPSARKPAEPQWNLVTIVDEGPMYRVEAWTGLPSDPASERMMLGAGATLLDASAVARLKARLLGIKEIVDLSVSNGPDLDGAA